MSPPSSTFGIPRALTIHQRNLPHWELGGSTYFITFRLKDGELSDTERRTVVDACAHWHNERAVVHLITVMPDHVHLLMTPLEKEKGVWHPLEELLHSIKSFTAHSIQKSRGRSGSLWQDEYFDRLVRDEDEFNQKWLYMVNNPVEARLVKQPHEYQYTYSPEEHDSEPVGRWSGRASREPGKKQREGGREAVDRVDHGRDARATGVGSRGRNERCDGALTFFPERYAKTFESWHVNLRDWCISRQLWWGHRIPVWTIQFKARFNEIADKYIEAGSRSVEGIQSSLCAAHAEAASKFLDAARGVGIDDHELAIQPDSAPMLTVCARTPRAEKFLEAISKRMADLEQRRAGGSFQFASPLQGFEPSFDSSAWIENWLASCERDPDVLDTWFSSALWPISTLGWPEPPADMKGLLEAFNPSAVLCTARDIITLWVSRMVMFNRYFLGGDAPGDGRIPFHDVYINPVVQDGHGQRMSKSLGNGVDPLDIVHSHGADAMRLVLCQIATATQDVRMPVDLACPHCGHAFEPEWTRSPAGYKVAAPSQTCPSCKKMMVSAFGVSSGAVKPTADAPQARNASTRFDAGRNFGTKLWNAARFAMMNLDASAGPVQADALTIDPARASLPDRWMLSRVAQTLREVDGAIANYQFSRYAELVYDLFWRDFCDWYLEAIKPTIKSSPAQQVVLHRVLDAIVRLLHPIMPYITEVLHAALRPLARGTVTGLDLRDHALACHAGWPAPDAALIDDRSEAEFESLKGLVEQIRQVRSAKGVEPRRKVALHAPAALAERVRSWSGLVEALAGLDRVESSSAPDDAAPFIVEGSACALSNLVDASDPEAERVRLTEALAKLDKDISVIEARLNNPGYAAKAPPHLVEETRKQVAQKQAERETLRARLGLR